ncbi:MAG TPA: MarR family transcriptional regulator, partial [Solirubrobacterales bacterium]|nr:MarR family transcriptional regulator [Solirubrobacterales bacterium]
MDLSRPFSGVSPGVEAEVLVVLAGAEARRTGREIARVSGRSATGVQHALGRLVEEGLVQRERAGRAHLYSLNREHLLAPVVEIMAGVRWELVQRLRVLIGGWKIPTFHASLFGSAARGDGNARSDLDLLVVRRADIDPEEKVWSQQLSDLAERVLEWTGNHAGIVEIAEADIPGLLEERPPVLQEVVDQGIDLAGAPVRK